jgi:hypothetical protein
MTYFAGLDVSVKETSVCIVCRSKSAKVVLVRPSNSVDVPLIPPPTLSERRHRSLKPLSKYAADHLAVISNHVVVVNVPTAGRPAC